MNYSRELLQQYKDLYDPNMSDEDARECCENMGGFLKLLIDINIRRNAENTQDAQRQAA